MPWVLQKERSSFSSTGGGEQRNPSWPQRNLPGTSNASRPARDGQPSDPMLRPLSPLSANC